MCNDQINIAIQYAIQIKDVSQYKNLLIDIQNIMIDLGAENFAVEQFLESKNKVMCVETFRFPSEAHFHALKHIRNTPSHSTFSKLNSLIGESKIYYVALKYEEDTIKHSSYSMQHITV
ncbi:hypothetical protein [Bacillus alkalisoli]|uniref:hypothetical protein n=1 Tax=Bacillus alkalisoli TaxID=2011008 RepID=UPI000C23A9CA|nr:hypothetical protein [Bacillus alkalisoli]